MPNHYHRFARAASRYRHDRIRPFSHDRCRARRVYNLLIHTAYGWAAPGGPLIDGAGDGGPARIGIIVTAPVSPPPPPPPPAAMARPVLDG